ncbi:MAG: CDP-diacylglycerol--glycerol-3-phosphate 3-phosphatidyltransferase [Ignavibacterium sp.]|nr:MAG: CDP-diacylglycerol--glycerol-3-phosphate 3-phosphatidyltransferase [Ignavibacterium sp.]
MILPNQLTILRIILSPIFLVLFLSPEPILKQMSLVVFIVAALSDWYDGWLARKFNYITEWGKFMDPLADKILTSTAFLGFAIVGLLEWWMVVIVLIRDFAITLLRVYADKKGYIFKTSNYAKWKTMLQMVFLYYLLIVYVLSFVPTLSSKYTNVFNILLDEKIIYYVMLLITIITVHTGYLYIRKNIDLIKKLFLNQN